MKKFSSIVSLIVFVVFPFVYVQACGPDFFPDVFVHKLRPDHPREYAAGKLGVLLSTYPRANLALAYRYLSGGKLSPTEQKGYSPTYSLAEQMDINYANNTRSPDYIEPLGPADAWLKARNRYAPVQPALHDIRQYGMIYSGGFLLAGTYLNCQKDAFRTAIATLESRARLWGAHSAELADWIHGQDAVFSNCGSASNEFVYITNKPKIAAVLPAPAPAGASLLLQQDRAYQIAAAQFYAAKFPAALASFRSIARNSSSPWWGIARYMVARTLIRDAFVRAKPRADDPMAGFDPSLMEQAQQQLDALRQQQLPGISKHAIESLLHLVEIRTEPRLRLAEISAALTGPKVDPFYAQDLKDLAWYLNARLDSIPIRADSSDFDFHVNRPANDYRPLTKAQKAPGFDQAYKSVADLRSISPLIDWLITVQSPSENAKQHAISEWQQTRRVPWLVAAIMKASASDAVAPALMQAAARVPATSPAWPTLEYHRIRLLVDLGLEAEARRQLAAALPLVQQTDSVSAVNLFAGLSMRSAASLNSALA